MKRDKFDIVFSNLVREIADFCCERCVKSYRHNTGGLDCSHIFSRRHVRTRWEPDNAQALCMACHNWYGENPYESGRWLIEVFGEGYMDILREKKESIFKLPKHEKELMYKHLKEEYRKMLEERETTEGRIEFTSYF